MPESGYPFAAKVGQIKPPKWANSEYRNHLVKEAVKEYENGGILKTNYDFKAKKDPPPGETLWYVPNENSGMTIMKPEDY
jgi:hypothetical protein